MRAFRITSWLKQPSRPARPSCPMTVESLEDRLTPAGGLLVAGVGVGADPRVLVFEDTGAVKLNILAYDAAFKGGVAVATGDVNGDGTADIITGAGAGAPGGHVKVFDGKDGALLQSFLAFPGFTGGVSVATGNINGDGRADIIVGAGAGAPGGHVKVFSGKDGALLQSFLAYQGFTGGVNVAAGDVNGDFRDDIITGAGAGSAGGHVKAFSGRDQTQLRSFLAYDVGFTGGVNVAAGDVNGDTVADILTGSGTNGHVRAFNGTTSQVLASFLPYGAAKVNGVSVAAADINEDGVAEILTSGGAGSSPNVRVFNGRTSALLGSLLPFDAGFIGGVTVAAAADSFGPVLHGPDAARASFIDPTAQVLGREDIEIGEKTYVGPFATLDATRGSIKIGEGTNVQDNALIQASDNGGVEIGDHVILAHGVSVYGPAKIGAVGGMGVFLSFNAVIDGATLEQDTIVSALGRVGPGVVLRAGTKVLPGKFVQTQDEADNPALGKVTPVTDGDRDLIAGILEVNENFARGYTALFNDGGINAVRGISLDPGDSVFNGTPDLPTLAGSIVAHPEFRNRIVGDVNLANTFAELNLVLGDRVSIKADEGDPFNLGTIARADDRLTIHALVGSAVTIGNNSTFGFKSIVHGGEDSANIPTTLSRIGDNVVVKDWAVVFRSTLGNNVTLGFRALVDASQLPDGTVVPDRAIISNGVLVGFVEW